MSGWSRSSSSSSSSSVTGWSSGNNNGWSNIGSVGSLACDNVVGVGDGIGFDGIGCVAVAGMYSFVSVVVDVRINIRCDE